MARAGIRVVRIAEFAWSRIEPGPGELDFAWLDRAVEILAEAGLQIVLCTPTATPPKWLVDQMPDMLAIDAQGRPRGFGSRRHYCFSHPGYLEECRRITRLVAGRYGEHPAVIAWQTDNEYGCHDTVESYSPAALAAFRIWLAERYDSIAALDTAWGAVFWSMEYRSFDEIELPASTVTEASPGHRLDFQRFSSDQVTRFNAAQVEILRRLSPGRDIVHNFMGRFDAFDHRPVARDIDVNTWDSYPIGFFQDMQRMYRPEPERLKRYLRVGDPDFQAFHHDLYRGMGSRRLWIMEQQPGPVNWAAHNPDPAPGAVRLWGWEAVAHGAEVVSYFRWRQVPFAQEQMHAGLNRPDGGAAPGLAEASQLASELARLAEHFEADGVAGAGDRDDEDGSSHQGVMPSAPVALIHDYQAAWMSTIDGQTEHYGYLRLLLDVYRAARVHGADIDVLGPDEPLDDYRLVLAPGLVHVSDDLARRLNRFDGELLLGPRTGAKTVDLQIPAELPPGPLAGLAGFRVERVDALPREFPVPLEGGGWFEVWREIGAATGEVERYTSDGHPAIIRTGRASYLAGWLDRDTLVEHMAGLLKRADIRSVRLPSGLRCRRRGATRIFYNYAPEPCAIPPAFCGDFVLGGPEVPPAGVAVVRV